MRDRGAHVVTLRETHVRDAVRSGLLAPRAFSAAGGALGVVGLACCSCCGMLLLLCVCLVLRREQDRGSEVVHAPAEQIYVVDTMQVDRLGAGERGGKEWKQGKLG